MSAVKYTGSFFMIACFVLALIGFAISFEANNDTIGAITGDNRFETANSTISNNLRTLSTTGKDSSITSLDESTLSSGNEATEGGEQFKVTLNDMLNISTSALRNSYGVIFGEDNSFSLFMAAIIAFITITTGYYTYKLWIGKNPD